MTGASGYVASHIVQQLLQEGYSVRGTVRSLKNESKIKPLRDLNNSQNSLELIEANLLDSSEKWVRLDLSL